MKTIYNITTHEAKILFEYCDNDTGKVAFLLWNTGKAKTLQSGIKKAKRIKNFLLKNRTI